MPANNRPTPGITITKTPVLIGNTIAKEPKMRASTPRPTVPHFDPRLSNIPLIIFSSPTMIKVMPIMYTSVATVIPGCMNTSIEKIIAKTPRPTSTPRFQPGDVSFI
jgi:hypothetical protein